MAIDDVKIEVITKDEEDGCYCAIVLAWSETDKVWFNSGIVVRDVIPIIAFHKALAIAIKNGWWK